jgi:3-oxoadipate enol-lactonase
MPARLDRRTLQSPLGAQLLELTPESGRAYPARLPEKYVYVDGIATLVRHRGPTTLPEVAPDTRRGEVVLFLHGTGGNSGEFDSALDGLASDHSPLAFDMPAHGRSAGLDSLSSIEEMADFTRRLVDKLGLRPLVLVGHGLGGFVAQAFALTSPERVRGLVLIGAGARCEVPAEWIERWRRVTEGKEQRRLPVEGFAPDTPREVFQRAFPEFLKTDPRARYGDLRAAQGWSAADRLAELRAPCLCVVGEHEREATTESVDALLERASTARKAIIPGAGYEIPSEQPEALTRSIHQFLGELAQ